MAVFGRTTRTGSCSQYLLVCVRHVCKEKESLMGDLPSKRWDKLCNNATSRDQATGVVIAGGGVGGLTLALLLHERGIRCAVFEASRRLKELGAGINVLPHGTSVLVSPGPISKPTCLAILMCDLHYMKHLAQEV
jgi:hypothetical protein